MPINVTTVYTKERLLKFSRVIASTKKLFWIIMAACSAIVIGAGLFLWLIDELSVDIIICVISVIALDAIYLFCYLVLPHLTVKKAKNLNTGIKYTFEEDCFRTEAVNAYTSETATTQYSILNKILKKDDVLYLFITSNMAYLVDLSSLSAEQMALLKELLSSKLPAKKVKW